MRYYLRLDKAIHEMFQKPVGKEIKKRLENLKPEIVSLVQKPKELLISLNDETLTELKNLAARENMSINRFINTYLLYDLTVDDTLSFDTDKFYYNKDQTL